MPSTYTTSLKLTLPATGELSGTWGTTVNTGITTLVDDAVAGTAAITVGGSDYTLSNTDGAANEARKMFITATGSPGAARNVIVPAVSKLYFVFNNTTGGFALTFKTSGGTGIAVAAGARMVLYCDGTNVVNALNAITLASPLPTSSGGTGLSSFTANRVFYASSTSAIGSSANLTFDGTTLGTSAFTATGNVNLNGGTFTFNDAGADLDARFEGDTDANLLFLDASTDRVGIGTSTPAAKLDVRGNATFTGNAAARQTADFTNTGGQLYVGVESSAGGAVFTGSSAYAGIVGTNTNTVLQLAANGAVRATITSGGDVGIGTSSPASRLDVSGSVNAVQARFGNVAGRGLEIGTSIISGTNDAGSVLNAKGATSGTLIFQTDSTERMRLDASGNLGIGTNSPFSETDYKTLTMSGAIGGAVRLVNGAGTVAYEMRAEGAILQFGSETNHPVAFRTNDTERMRITSSGDVGIGTSSPSAKLHVQRDFGGIAETLRLQNNSTNATVGRGAQIAFVGTSGGLLGSISGSTSTTADDQGSLIYSANGATSSHLFFTNSAERMRLDASGNLGLGVTPSAWGSGNKAIEQIGGALFSGATSSIFLGQNTFFDTAWKYKNTAAATYYQQTSGAHQWFNAPSGTAGNTISFTQAMTLDGSGNLLVGTTSGYRSGRLVVKDVNRTQASTTANLHVSTTDSQAADLGGSIGLGGQVGGDEAPFAVISGRKENSTSGNYAGYLAFATQNSSPATAERMRITSGGDVGIGTTTPSAKLHVSGTGAQALWISTLTSGDPSMSLRAEGVNAGSMTYRRSDSNFVFDNGAATFLASDASLNVVAGAGAVATTASNGFFYVPTCAGTPTGTPTAKTGYAPIVVDTTNNKLYFYSGGQWRDAGP